MMQTGVDSGRAAGMAAAIVDWRTPSPVPTDLDAYYLGLPSSFRPAHTSFQEIEELLLIRGMTPEIFYGWTERTPEGKLVTHTGLRDCVSIFGSSGAGGLDINTAQPGVMIAAGIPSDIVARIVRQRAVRPYKKEDLPALLQEHPSTSRLIVGGRTVYTLRSTARLKLANGQLSDLRRTVEAQVGRGEMSVNGKSWQILRWYDNAPRLQ
jgi:general secretion pathway protein K